MRILVTGGSGFVGTKLVPALASRGYQVVVYDLGLFGDVQAQGDVMTVKGDIRDTPVLQRALAGVDVVIHLAAVANDPCCDLNPRLTESINIDGSLSVLRLAAAMGVNRFIFASSASVYGISDRPEVDEDTPLRPLTIYARSKAVVEEAVLNCNCSGFVTTALRPATLCGYAPRLRLDLTLNIFVKQAWFDGRITIHGGSQLRPNLAVSDMVEAYLTILDAKPEAVGGRAFNVSCDNLSVSELAQMARLVTCPTAGVTISPLTDARSYRLSGRRIHEELGFTPRVSLTAAAAELRDAFHNGLIRQPEHERYYNVRTMIALGRQFD